MRMLLDGLQVGSTAAQLACELEAAVAPFAIATSTCNILAPCVRYNTVSSSAIRLSCTGGYYVQLLRSSIQLDVEGHTHPLPACLSVS